MIGYPLSIHEKMVTLDVILLIIIGLGMVLGLVKGFIRQLASLLGLVVGLLAAKTLYVSLAAKLSPLLGASMTLTQALSFVLIWIAVPLLFTLVAALLTKAMEVVALGWLNRLLGAALGALKYALLISLFVGVVDLLDPDHHLIDKTYTDESVLYEPIKSLAEVFFPMAKSAWEEL